MSHVAAEKMAARAEEARVDHDADDTEDGDDDDAKVDNGATEQQYRVTISTDYKPRLLVYLSRI